MKAHWPLAPCDSSSGLAIDTADHKLFAVCDNHVMAIVDANFAKMLATPAIGEGRTLGVRPGTKLAFATNADGLLLS